MTTTVQEQLQNRTMTVEAIQERRATLYKGLEYRRDHFIAAAMKTDLDYLLSIQQSHVDEVDTELARWQNAIRDKLIDLGAPDWKIDGGGCDSGDPLDFTLAEVMQGAGYFIDQLEAAQSTINKLAEALKSRVSPTSCYCNVIEDGTKCGECQHKELLASLGSAENTQQAA